MLDAHSEALQNSTCCRPRVPGWCHPAVHQSLQSQLYLASIAWCQMILAHVLDFLCTDWNQCSFMLSIDCAASFCLRHGSKIVRRICRGSSYLINSLAISGLSCAYLAITLGDAVTLFFRYPCPGAITSLHFSHGHILVIWELDAGVYLGVCVGYVRNVGHLNFLFSVCHVCPAFVRRPARKFLSRSCRSYWLAQGQAIYRWSWDSGTWEIWSNSPAKTRQFSASTASSNWKRTLDERPW